MKLVEIAIILICVLCLSYVDSRKKNEKKLRSSRNIKAHKRWSEADEARYNLQNWGVLNEYNEFMHLIEYEPESNDNIIKQLKNMHEIVVKRSEKCANFIKKAIEEANDNYHNAFKYENEVKKSQYYLAEVREVFEKEIGEFLICIKNNSRKF